MSFIRELRRRNVFRMAVLYLVAAWLVMQVAEVLVTLGNLPDWVGPAVLVILTVSFPLALIFSWFFEVTPEGITLERNVDPEKSITHLTGRKLDFVVISLLFAAVVFLAFDKWWMQGPVEKSIAVLPFENMSADPEQEYFSDGISEELLNLLAQVPELRVISRTSSFSFREQNLEIQEIAERLNVAHVLEGSVRKSGNTLRITAQLIKADDGFHLWSNSYDRDLDDIFAVQDEIATAISDALKVKLAVATVDDGAIQPAIFDTAGGDAGNADRIGRAASAKIPTKSPEAHAAYLKGRYFLNKRTGDGLRNAKEQFEYAIQIDPDYALAYSGLADTYLLLAGYGHSSPDEVRPKQRAAAYRALELDETSAEAHVSVGAMLAIQDWNWRGAERELKRAIEINPNYALALQWYGSTLAMLGDPGHLAMMERAHAVDPVSLRVNVDFGLAYYFNEEYDQAILQLRKTIELDPEFRPTYGVLGLALVESGNFADGIAMIEKGAGGGLSRWLGYAHAKAGNTDDALAILDEWHARWEETQSDAVAIALIYVGLGQLDDAFDWLNEAVDQKSIAVTTLKSYPYWNPLRVDPRYDELLGRLNLPIQE